VTEAEHITGMNCLACLQEEFCSGRYPLGLQKKPFSPFWKLYVSCFAETLFTHHCINLASRSKSKCACFMFSAPSVQQETRNFLKILSIDYC